MLNDSPGGIQDLAEYNHYVYQELLGLPDNEFAELPNDGVST